MKPKVNWVSIGRGEGYYAPLWIVRQPQPHGSWIVPIRGRRSGIVWREHRSGRDRADPEDLAEIDRAASEIQVEGDRYPEHLERLIGR